MDILTTINQRRIEDEVQGFPELIKQLLDFIGEDPKREGLLKTPERVTQSWKELTSGYHVDIDALINRAVFHENYNEMVVVKDIRFYSVCEHHLLPFFGVAHVAYIPNGKILGLSKIPKIVEVFSRRLQVQERLTQEIADILQTKLKPMGVGVVINARHLCMEMRGAKSVDSPTVTSAMLGAFRNDARTRKEFLSFINGSH
ncbi:MAG: GTP cyclohydrolase I FolE [Elusimicrobia bacterium]|nr:GTP cyclohydrolase I FolE [Candidatus Obscuribacterium magneticum]